MSRSSRDTSIVARRSMRQLLVILLSTFIMVRAIGTVGLRRRRPRVGRPSRVLQRQGLSLVLLRISFLILAVIICYHVNWQRRDERMRLVG